MAEQPPPLAVPAPPAPPAAPPQQMPPPAQYVAVPAVPTPVPVMTLNQTVVNAGEVKSIPAAVVLALFFGPLGMIYSTLTGAAVMFVVSLVVVIPTLGVGLLFTLPICAAWAWIATDDHNKRVRAAVSQTAWPVAAWAPPPGQYR